MKKFILGTILLAWILLFPAPTIAGVDVGISISLPPLIIFPTPPALVVLPETNVYVVPDLDEDIFFYNGWWWRPWEGRWYRSRNYRSGWGYYQNVPSFYRGIPSDWRNDYRDHRWRGHPWDYQRIPHRQVQQNWRNWEKNRHWEKKNTWGVQGLKPQPRSRQPSQALQPGSQPKPQSREVAGPQPSRPQSREVQPKQSRPQSQTARPQSREAAGPQPSRPQSREIQPKQSRPQSQTARPQSREAAGPQPSHPQSQAVQSQRSQPQHSQPQQGKPERGGGERQDRR